MSQRFLVVSRQQQLAGDIWFYYGSRYGEYLDLTRRANPEDYLPAGLEATPGRAGAYLALADYYRERGEFASALGDYAHTLELDPLSAEAQDQMAEILWQQGKKDEAVARWAPGSTAAAERALNRIHQREVGGSRCAGYVGVACRVYGYPCRGISAAATEKRAVNQGADP